MWYYVYILFSKKDRKLYIGYTANLKRRLDEHMSGRVRSTSWRRPLVCIHYEAYLSQEDALRREDYFKTTFGKRALKIMMKGYFFEHL